MMALNPSKYVLVSWSLCPDTAPTIRDHGDLRDGGRPRHRHGRHHHAELHARAEDSSHGDRDCQGGSQEEVEIAKKDIEIALDSGHMPRPARINNNLV